MLGVLITIHEFGHFIFAKMFGVRVEVFSIGFGPPIFRKKIGETLYQIALIPLGGYVKMYGEDSMTEPVQGEVDKSAFEDPRSFHAKPRWQKILIAFAGPLFNFILAIVLFAVAYMMGIPQPQYMDKPVVIGYVAEDSLAEKIGLQPGDKIVAIDNEPVKNWKDLTIKLGMKAGHHVVLTIERNGKLIKKELDVPEDINKMNLGISPYIPPVIGAVQKGSPAEKAGLKKGDRIIAINDKFVKSWYDIAEYIHNYKGDKPLKIFVKRGNKTLVFEVKPVYDEKLKTKIIGIAPIQEVKIVKYGFFEAIEKSFERTKELTIALFKVIKGLITGEVSIKTLGGPIAIAQFSGQALETGLSTFLFSMAFISLQLAYLNLLPIPVLDGGLILILLIESIIRRPLPDKFKEALAYVGFALIGTLMLFVIYNDIMRAISG
jgi:regulator of sigma E protease